jgi:hypothetical protein
MRATFTPESKSYKVAEEIIEFILRDADGKEWTEAANEAARLGKESTSKKILTAFIAGILATHYPERPSPTPALDALLGPPKE